VSQALRLRGPLAAHPTARMLHALVLTLAVWWALWSIILLPLYPNLALRLPVAALQELGPIGALLLLRVGFLQRASLIYLLGTWVFTTVVMALNGGIRSPVQTLYAVLPILAAWLLGYAAALWVAVVCLSSALVFASLELAGVQLTRILPVTPLAIWVNLLQVILIGAVPVAHVLRRLRETLVRSRRSEEELQEYKERLEQLVQQRTEELVGARDQALAANRAKGVFLANMSHELRTPLNAILGFSGLLRENAVTDEQRQDLDVINRSGEHLLNVINAVLDLAKIDSGRVEIAKNPVNLPELVRDVTELMLIHAKAKGLELRVEGLAEIPRFIRSDSDKLRGILINLLSNAVKYTDRGTVTLRLFAKDLELDRVVLKFEVEDTGIGIAPGDQGRIFDAFVQTGKTASQKGTGLGLTITRQFVELMGGTIHVESRAGKGSRFCIELPVARTEDSEIERSKGSEERIVGLKPDQPEYRILIVEDEKENWLLLQRILQNAGFTVRVAEEGAEAVEMFQSWRPHFIWMDLRMPVMEGAEATRRIRALPGGADVKIAAVTASAFASEREGVLAAGVDDFVRKPYRSTEIFNCLARHLGVQYRVRTTRSPSHGNLAKLRPEEMRALPGALRTELAGALARLDTNRVTQIIKQVGEQDTALASMLLAWADRFAYSEILDTIAECDSTFTGSIL
jgi:signal transduction histidine kinase/CheY-like chemotaxis protein